MGSKMKEEKKSKAEKFFSTSSGIELKHVYTSEDVKGVNYDRDIGLPGEYPYTRGPYPEMYRTFPWMIRQLFGFQGGAETVKRQKELLASGGQVGYGGEPVASIAPDTVSHWGFDADNPMVKYQVGVTGTSLNSIEDFKELIGDFPVDKGFYNLAFQGVASYVLFCMYVAAAEEMGFSQSKLRGSAAADPIGSRLGFRVEVFPVEAELKLSGDVLEHCIHHMPRWNAISVGGFNIRGNGLNTVEELALTLAAAVTYIENGLERGLNVDKCAQSITFFMASSMDFLEEVAKLRTARRLWAKILHEKFGVRDTKAMKFRVYSQTWTCDYTSQQPYINIVRGTVQALAAALGGCQAMFVTPYDEAWALPTIEAVMMAIRTQQILIEESGITKTGDPMGGSYCIEYLTNEIEDRVKAYLDNIRALGTDGSMKSGMLSGLKNGYLMSDMDKKGAKRESAINSGESVVVGRNKFVAQEDSPPPIFKIDPEYQQKRIDEVKKFKASRDMKKVKNALNQLRKAAENNENLMPHLIEAAKDRVTLEESTCVLRDVFGVSEMWIGRNLQSMNKE
jgi:methylmalonyl-CoA mutase N-terminal domain/subunit